MPSLLNHVIDLTMDTSSDGDRTADEVVVAAAATTQSARITFHHKKGEPVRALRSPPSTFPLGPAEAPGPSSSTSQRCMSHGSPARRPSAGAAVDGTPSRSTRLSGRVEIRDSHSPSPTRAPNRPPRTHHSPGAQTPKKMDWTVDKIASILTALSEEVSQGHARLVDFMLEEADKKAQRPRHLSTTDAFAGVKSIALDSASAPREGVEAMAVKSKQHSGDHGKSKGSGRRTLYPVVCIMPDRDPVPGYRFHHVEIRKNILAPNSMLNFVPHLRDVDPNSAEEKKYSNWLIDLESLDSKSGFQIQNRSQKLAKRARNEYAATLAPYLEPWLRKLSIDGCTKSTLIRYMATQPQNEDAITPQQKSSLLDTYSSDIGSPKAVRGAKLFTEAFDRVFNDESKPRRVALRDILMLDKTVEPILENRRAKDGPPSQNPRDKALMQKLVESLGSYTALGCLICFSHDCEHGDIDWENQKRCFSLEEIGGLAPILRRKWLAQLEAQKKSQLDAMASKPTHQPCRNQCYRSYDTGNPNQDVKPWTESEITTLESVFATIGYSQSLKPQCFVGALLGRYCWDVSRKLKELDLSLPPVDPRPEPPRPKTITWYDRKRKQLLGDWQDATITHEHAVRELFAPCHHEGPCTAANGCPCASALSHPVLCERFCHCTADECALKFTGCACHSSGKTCLQRQKEGRPCICVQLNRECDPVLCRGCGAAERADPENAYDEHLHSTGCQNVALQRGAAKTVVLGKSQLEGCGYGLFAAEDIAQDEFVIEYTGELISHDEGVRRENRRGDVFDEENKVSYLFTLLEQEGIWVDAAIYGNLSRYINHASDTCNIMPRIMYVNHEYRIKFLAIRDIKAGEELFFNYGDNFPNLTKKLVEQRNEKSGDTNSAGAAKQRQRKGGAQRSTARKTTSKAKGEGIDFPADDDDDDLWLGDMPIIDDDDQGDDWADGNPKRRKKRGGRRPGAGRKKKQPEQQPPPLSAPAAAAADNGGDDDEVSPGSQLRTESNGFHGTPTRRRAAARRSFADVLNPQRSFSGGSDAGGSGATPASGGVGEQPIKKVSKRGGARPGAGRKPKHLRPPGTQKPSAAAAAAATTTANGNGGAGKGGATNAAAAAAHSQSSAGSSFANNTSSNGSVDSSVAASNKRAAAADGTTPNKRTGRSSQVGVDSHAHSTPTRAAGRKRKAAEVEEDEGEKVGDYAGGGNSAVGLYRQDVFQPIDEVVSSNGDSRNGDEVEDEVVDRSARKRQKPLRYRDPNE
ncbi:hypothetical protein VTK26DRAFT_7270 [Humicola hyalothermophila]